MKGPVSLLLLFVFLFCGIDAQIGFKTTLSQNGINYLKDVGMQILQGQLASLSIPDMNGRAETPVGHVSYSLTNIVLKGATIPGSSVTLTPPSSLSVAISNSQASMSLDWHYKEDSFPHVEDHGSADVTISSTSIGIVIQIGESNGHASGTASSCSVDIGVIKIDVHGGASWLYNWFISEFSGQIKSAAESALKSQIPTSVNQGLASAFNSMPIVEPINSKIELNYKLMSAPAVTSSYFTLSSLGEFYSTKDPQNAPFSPSSLPDIATTQMVQMFISDFTANSAAFVFFTEDVIHYTITDNMLPSNAPLRLNTTYFTELIPAFQKAYPNQMFSLFLYARDTPVTTFSSTAGAQVMINGAIDFVMENKTTAFTLGLKVLTQGDAKLNGLNITADLTYVNTSLTLLNSTCGEFDVSVLQQIVGSLVIALLPSANKILEAGFPLPTITGLSFQNPTIGWGDGYMYVSTDATYTPKVTNEIIAPTKIAVNVIN